MPTCTRNHQLRGSLTYHVFNRSAVREPIFHASEDFKHFINLLARYKKEFSTKIYHWVIMPTHFHLLIEMEEPLSISSLMSGLTHAYTIYHHKRYLTRGFLWQGRFKLQPVQKEGYLITCGRYIERNPVRSTIVERAEAYLYSSARFYCLGVQDIITNESPCYANFGPDDRERPVRYRDFLKSYNSEEDEPFRNLEQPVGEEDFVNLLRKTGTRHMPQHMGRPRRNTFFGTCLTGRS
ncbi:MAG: transposase [bacterium]